MTPDVSEAVGQIVAGLSLTSGPVLDELQDAAATAKTVEELPQWARVALAGIRARGATPGVTGRTPEVPAKVGAGSPVFDEARFDDPQFVDQVFGGDQGEADFASRMLGDPNGITTS